MTNFISQLLTALALRIIGWVGKPLTDLFSQFQCLCIPQVPISYKTVLGVMSCHFTMEVMASFCIA